MVLKKLANLYKSGSLGYYISKTLISTYNFFNFSIYSDKKIIDRKFKKVFGYKPDLKNPKTLNEKIQWLKLNERKDFHTIVVDKFEVRNWLSERFGSKYLIPLIYHTDNWKNINKDNIKQFPCIIKANHTSGDYKIIRNPYDIDWKELKNECRWWLNKNYYQTSQEWQYKNVKPQIVVEHLLTTKDGKIPNDYKLHFFNGELEFIYVSVDREGKNKRNIYDADWNPLLFTWVSKYKNHENVRGEEIAAPESFEEMKRIGTDIAKLFKYVRVDFYDVDGKLYFGEITLHHGGGFDVFCPKDYDLHYGKKLLL